MTLAELDLLRWAHIIAMVYWLGGEWGVFQTSYNVVNRNLSLDERRRHMETAYRIDILARTGIVLLLPLGIHMGWLYGFVPVPHEWLLWMWVGFGAWLALTWSAFLARETDLGLKLTTLEEWLRYPLIAAILYVGVASWLGRGPLTVAEGTMWYPAKLTVYGLLLVIGLMLRFIMRAWTVRFRQLAAGPNLEAEAALERDIGFGRMLAYVYWIGIAGVCFLGATKPF